MIDELVTVVIPTSPIPCHPETGMMEECLAAVRNYLPSSKIVVMADGVRAQVEHRRHQYNEYLDRINRTLADGHFGDASIRRFSDPSQQAIMTQETLREVTTPVTLFVEHDAILRADPRIDVQKIVDLLVIGDVNLVRLYAWGEIWHEHQYLMRGEMDFQGQRFVKTVQYSQWPLFTRTDYHRQILEQHFRPGQRAMIETVMYSPVVRGSWEDNRIVIYGPDGSPTFSHRNGRMDEKTGYRDPSEW